LTKIKVLINGRPRNVRFHCPNCGRFMTTKDNFLALDCRFCGEHIEIDEDYVVNCINGEYILDLSNFFDCEYSITSH